MKKVKRVNTSIKGINRAIVSHMTDELPVVWPWQGCQRMWGADRLCRLWPLRNLQQVGGLGTRRYRAPRRVLGLKARRRSSYWYTAAIIHILSPSYKRMSMSEEVTEDTKYNLARGRLTRSAEWFATETRDGQRGAEVIGWLTDNSSKSCPTDFLSVFKPTWQISSRSSC